jgi:hypothetical protein
MATELSSIDSRAWFTATLDEAGRRLGMAVEAGAVDPEVNWDSGDVALTAKLHNGGVTITARASDGTVPVGPLTILAGWLGTS